MMQDETIFPQKSRRQGSVLSPLLASIAFNGIEDWIAEIPVFSPGGHRIFKPNRRKRLLLLNIRKLLAMKVSMIMTLLIGLTEVER